METKVSPLPEVCVPAGESVLVWSDTVSPGNKVWPVGLEMSHDAASCFRLMDVRVGPNSQLLAGGSVPCTLFADLDVQYEFDVLEHGYRFGLLVANWTSADKVFAGSLRFSTAEPRSSLCKIVGLGQTPVKPLGAARIEVRPQLTFEPRRLYVPSYLLECFEVVDVSAEKYLDVEVVPRVSPREDLEVKNLRRGGIIALQPTQKVQEGCALAVTVRNMMSSDRVFEGALLGGAS